MIRLAHCSDTHLDADARAAGKILRDAQGLNVRFEDRKRAFRSAAEGAIERGCHLFIHSGDTFERPRPTPAEYCAAEEVFDLIVQHMPCITIADNHSAVESAAERHGVEPLMGRNPHLHVSVAAELLTIQTGAGPVQVCTLPSPRRSIVAAQDETRGLSPAAINALISDKLRSLIHGFRARLDPTLPSILVYHGGVQGAWLTDLQQATGTEAIRLNPQDLDGVDYCALGDFHAMQQVTPRAWYSGATDRCSFGEESQAKGWLYVELSKDKELLPVVHMVETPARRYVTYSPEELTAAFNPSHCPPDPIEHLSTMDVADPDYPIIRVKGSCTQEEYDSLQPLLARMRTLPIFSEQIEVTRETRARSAGMTGALTPEASLRLWHSENNRPEDLDRLLAAHRKIAGAAR